MEESINNPIQPEQTEAPAAPPGTPWQAGTYTPPPKITFPMGKKELIFALGILIFSMLLCNSLFYGGVNLGVGIAVLGLLGCTFVYLRSCGHKPDRYTAILLILCAVIAAAFPRSDDSGMKFLMACLLLVVPGLAFCLMAKQNLRSPDGITSLLDSPRSLFVLGMGRMGESARGIREACSAAGTVGARGGAVILGVCLAVPVVAVLIPLLISADAAFEGLLDLLPETDWAEIFNTILWGVLAAYILYTRGAALQHLPKTQREAKERKGLNAITVNTVLIAVVFVYLVYLASQLAYFVGGFAGILPEEYTLAEYARRGFFEMGWLCAINLSVMALSMGLVTAKGKAPLLTRLLCLFIGLVTLFLVATASAKMVLYIGSYGLTRMRVLTEVFMVWLAVVTAVVCVWIFRPKTSYMKCALVLGLVFCAVLMWADVDSQVTKYNVRAYQSGRLDTVDIRHLQSLNDSAVPYLEELTQDSNADVAKKASDALKNRWYSEEAELRSWNWPSARAREILEPYQKKEAAEVTKS